jgi:hypothetical protein
MNLKNFFIILILFCFLLPVNKLLAKSTGTEIDTIKNSISDVKKIIEEKTPDFIIQFVTSTIDKIEKFREDTKVLSDNKKEKAEKVESFLFSLISLILDNKILFYGVLILIVFFVLRFIWNIVF